MGILKCLIYLAWKCCHQRVIAPVFELYSSISYRWDGKERECYMEQLVLRNRCKTLAPFHKSIYFHNSWNMKETDLIWRSSLLVKMIPSICHSVYLIGKSLLIEILSLWKWSKFLYTTSRMWYSWLGYFAQTTRNNWTHLIEHGARSRRYVWSKNSRILIVWEGFRDHLVQRFSNMTTYPNPWRFKEVLLGPSSGFLVRIS